MKNAVATLSGLKLGLIVGLLRVATPLITMGEEKLYLKSNQILINNKTPASLFSLIMFLIHLMDMYSLI